MERRVVITGLGTVNPAGLNVKETWNNMINGKSCIVKNDRIDVSEMASKVAGLLPKSFNFEDFLTPKEIKRNSEFIMYGMIAADEAIKDSGIDVDREDPTKIGVITGSGIGGIKVIEQQHLVMLERGPRRISPFTIIRMITDMLPGRISMKYGYKGTNLSVSSACASSAHAIIESFHNIKRGTVDVMITGGAESPITDLSVGAFCTIQALSTHYNDNPEKASRPFEKNRDGFVMAEGGAIIVLEEYEHAKKRGAHIYAEIVGTGSTADAYHDTAPAPRGEGGRRAMELALQEGKIDKEKIGYINAHGTSTKYNDLNETLAIKDLFGEYAYKIPVSSIKSMIGHSLGAAAAIEAVISALVIEKSIIPPTINYEEGDPECDLDYVPNKAREKKVDYIISNSFGFGGHNGVILFGRI